MRTKNKYAGSEACILEISLIIEQITLGKQNDKWNLTKGFVSDANAAVVAGRTGDTPGTGSYPLSAALKDRDKELADKIKSDEWFKNDKYLNV